ncbi:MAG: hypothetical protein IPM16_00640 [Chloroflexi bacterium]|nr:hypothetical protein [Chloroflexota bacterium]
MLSFALWPHAASAQSEIPASYQLAAENDLFELHLDHATLAFKLLDKRSGYVWHSGIDELQEEDRLNRSWHAFAQSGLSIEYLDSKAIDRRVSIANTEHTLEITEIERGVLAQATFTAYGISVAVRLQLDDEGVRIEVPFDSVREDSPDFRLGRLFLYPFLGATRGASTPGYILLPDGTGSLVRFADSTKARNMFYGRYYGADLGITSYQPWSWEVNNPLPISYPVFGISHDEQNAFVSIIEDGSSYGELQVHPAGIITNFNFAYNAFVYNQTYFQATNRSGAGVTVIQRQTNPFDIVVHYRFLTGEDADYVGMAHSYRQYLQGRDILHARDDDTTDIGIKLEFLGGDNEEVLAWDRFVTMTTIDQMRDILADLQLPNPEVIYYGWQPLGATSMPPLSLALEGSLGTVDQLRALTDSIAAAGGHFSLYLEPQVALWGRPGYSARSELAISITNVEIEGYNRYYNHFFSFDALRERYTALSADVASNLGAGLALDSIGSTLYSDFREDPPRSRESTAEAYQALLVETPVRLSIYRPNDYLFGLAQAYYDMPLGDNAYIYTSESVPFLPIVLSGSIPYYGTALNFSSNRQDDLLRHVEYGIYPSYFLTHEPTARMLNTPSSWIYSSSYAQWGEQIRHTYAWMNALLGPVIGQEIVAHEALADGVFVTTYANGRQIVVNYTDQTYVHDAVAVEPKDAVLMESVP